MEFASLVVKNHYRASTDVERARNRVPHPLFVAVPRLELIHDKLYEMSLVSVNGLKFIEFQNLPVNPHLGKSFLPHLLEKFPVVTLATPDQRCEEQTFATAESCHYHIDNLVVGIAHHRLARHRRIRR